MRNDSVFIGYIFLFLNLITWGAYPVASHFLVFQTDPLVFAGIVATLGSIPLLVLLAIKRKTNELLKSSSLPNFFAIGILSFLANFAFFQGTKLTSGINTSLLLQLEPIYAFFLSFFFLQERYSKWYITASLTILTGAVIIVYRGIAVPNLGDLLIAITPLFYQVAHVFAKRLMLKVKDPDIISTARQIITGVLLITLATLRNPKWYLTEIRQDQILPMIIFAVIFISLDTATWYQAIKRLPLAKASSFLPISALIAFFGSLFFLGETVGSQQVLGAIFILGGLVWISLQSLAVFKK